MCYQHCFQIIFKLVQICALQIFPQDEINFGLLILIGSCLEAFRYEYEQFNMVLHVSENKFAKLMP